MTEEDIFKVTRIGYRIKFTTQVKAFDDAFTKELSTQKVIETSPTCKLI